MSSKQLAAAAHHGRRITFRFLRGGDDNDFLTGYLVGMDDYHLLLAIPRDSGISLALVGKGRADIVELHPDSTYDDEPEEVLRALEDVGSGFRAFCADKFFNQDQQPKEPMS